MRTSVEIGYAKPEEEGSLRQILRQSPMPGWVTLTYEREPNINWAGEVEGHKHQFGVARTGKNGPTVGFFGRSVRNVLLNQKVEQMGYLSQLRFDPSFRYRLSALRKGYAFWRDHIRKADELPYDLTSILVDNEPARRLLESDAPGFPVYLPWKQYSTIIIRSSRRKSLGQALVKRSNLETLPKIISFIQSTYKDYALAPYVSEEDVNSDVRTRGLSPSDFLYFEEGGEILGCLGLWNQNAFKQSIVQGYRPPLGIFRSAVNMVGPLFGWPRLPTVGQPIDQAFLAFCAIKNGLEKEILPSLISAAREEAGRLGLTVVLGGWVEGEAALSIVRDTFMTMEYKSILYFVHWPEDKIESVLPSQGKIHVELATL